MKLWMTKIILYVLISQMIIPTAICQDLNFLLKKGVTTGNFDLGSSFRNNVDSINTRIPNQDEALKDKGLFMTEPSMSGLMYQVHVLGEVNNPGTYRIAASDRLSEVLNKAGGVNEHGSERNIEVRRQGEKLKKMDLMAFQTFGSLSNNPYLLDNDVVFVPLKTGVIRVVGAVQRPKDYEIKDEKTLFDAIALAGNVSVGAAINSPIKVVRFENGKKEIFDVLTNETDMKNFYIQNGDIIFVPHVITEKNKFDFDVPKLPGDNIFYPSFEDRVFILGGVTVPGAYQFNPYYTLPQYLSVAGGTTKMSTGKISILSPSGKSTKITKNNRNTIVINPGDTIVIDESRIPPEGWVTLFMSIAGFGLSTSATILALRNR